MTKIGKELMQLKRLSRTRSNTSSLEISSNDDIISVTSGLVLSEFYDLYQQEHNKLIQEQKRVKDSVKEYVQYMSSIKKINRINNAIDILNVEPRLTYVLNKILKKTVVLREQSIYRNFADYRLRNKMAPAAKKSEYKDCYIWGTFLELIHIINPTSSYLAFMTVKIKDYKENNQLHPHILTDCHLPSMKVIFNIGALYRDISNSLGFRNSSYSYNDLYWNLKLFRN